jgi:glycosyltransferase involved in cell wall biosynthesis
MDHAKNSPILQRYTQTPEKVVEVHNGIDTDRFRPGLDGEPFRRSLGLTIDDILMVFVGTMDRAHHDKLGVLQLLHAFAGLKTKHVFLALIGGGEMLPVYQALAQELGLGSQVAFTGMIPNEEIGPVYAAANFTVQPSLFEPFGLTIAEAMACGKPVITTNVPGVRSIVHDGEDGLLAEPGSIDDLGAKIQSFIDSPERCKAMGAKGRKKIESQYAWPKIASQLEQVYQNALQ